MKKILYIALLAATASVVSCTPNTEKETYDRLIKSYFNADSKKHKEEVELKAQQSLTATEFEKFQRTIHPENYRDPKTAYDSAEKEAVEAYVAEHNRLCRMYHQTPAGTARRDSLMKEMEQLEKTMRNQHQREAYEAFLLLRDSI